MKQGWQIGIIASVVFALVGNFVVGAQLLDLPTITAVSDAYATLLTPAGYAFSIWSLIYLLLIVFAVYQARDLLSPDRANNVPQTAGPLFILANVLNGLWPYVFVNEWIGVSVVVLFALTGALYGLLWKLRIAMDDVPIVVIACVWWPIMVYAGWVSIASVVNLASLFDAWGVAPEPLVASGSILLVTSGLAALLAVRHVRELVLAAVWGIVAIGVRQLQVGGDLMVGVTALVAAGMLLILVAYHAYRHRHETILAKLQYKQMN